jgi:selenocysteine lyase/cysteine desulfurase
MNLFQFHAQKRKVNVRFNKNQPSASSSPACTFLNHGAFGATMTPLLHEANNWRFYCEQQPLSFFDRTLLPLTAHVLREMSLFLDVPPAELVPLSNVTAGLNSVMHTVRAKGLTQRDNVVALNITYGSTKKMLADLASGTGAQARLAELPLQLAPDADLCTWYAAILSALRAEVDEHTKLVVLDHITSNTALELPIIDMAKAVKQIAPNALVCVDAAHTMFTLPVDIYQTATADNADEDTPSSSNGNGNISISNVVDFWISNGHKWLAAPKGIAFMWISPKCMQEGVRPVIVSHGYQPGSDRVDDQPGSDREGGGAHGDKVSSSNANNANHFIDKSKILSAFAWDGCRDYGALLTIPSALRVWRYIANAVANENEKNEEEKDTRRDRDGLHPIRRYNLNTMNTAENMLKSVWKIDKNMFLGHAGMREQLPMRLIPLPWEETHNGTCTDVHAFILQETLYRNGIEAPIKCIHGNLYIRLSAHIYNTSEDYIKLVQVMDQLLPRRQAFTINKGRLVMGLTASRDKE